MAEEQLKPEISGEVQVRNESGRFVPGVSGNPVGKPKGTLNIATKKMIKELRERISNHGMQEVDVQVKDQVIKMTRAEVMMNILFEEGFKNKNVTAVKEYLDRTVGKPSQEVGLYNSDKLEEYEEKLKNLFNVDYVSATFTEIKPAQDTGTEVST